MTKPKFTEEEVRRMNQGLPPRETANLNCVVWADTIKQAPLEWLWPGAIPRGSIVILEGRKAVGKSTMAAAIVASMTGGPPLPDWAGPTDSRALWCAAEDSWPTVVAPRLTAAGANLRRIGEFRGIDSWGNPRRPQLPEDLPQLRRLIQSAEIGLLVLDPYVSICDPSLDVRIEQQARMYLDPLAAMLGETGATAILLRHLRKGTGGDAREAGLGNVAVGNAARAILRCDEHPHQHGDYVLSVVASNHGQRMPTRIYRFARTDGDHARIEWVGSIELDADTIAEGRGSEAERDEWNEADRLLAHVIGKGFVDVSVIMTEAERAGVSPRTLRRAKARLRLPSLRVQEGGQGHWKWGPPKGGFPVSLLDQPQEEGGAGAVGRRAPSDAEKHAPNPEKNARRPRRPRARTSPPKKPKIHQPSEAVDDPPPADQAHVHESDQ